VTAVSSPVPFAVDDSSLMRRLSKGAIVLLSLSWVVGVAFVDAFVPNMIPIMVFYLPPVAVICWVINLRTAITLSLICSLLWILDEAFAPTVADDHLMYWVSGVHFAFFVVVTTVLSRLRRAHEQAKHEALTDRLTGLPNGRAFTDACEREIANSQRSNLPLTVALIDCDSFKQVNDTLGHLEGDRLLNILAQAMRNGLRSGDMLARLGGDEFGLLLPMTTQAEAESVVKRLQDMADQAMAENAWPVSLSIGVVSYDMPPETVTAAILQADRRMYATKRAGKNAIQFEHVASA
jgi:diguanylate cyclase (GGDEF)-like protein